MAKLQNGSISNRMVAALKVERDTMVWDRALTGFGVRAYPSGGRVYVAQARGPKGPKRVTVGRNDVLNADEARRRAALIIARIKAGEEPVPEPLAVKLTNGPSVGELAARYLKDHVAVRCKPKTAKTTRSVVNRHIVPVLGRLSLAAVARKNVTDLHHGLSDRPAIANTAVKTLSHMYTLADEWGMVDEGVNPCRSVLKYPSRRRERFLTDTEFERLSRILDEFETEPRAPHGAIAAIRLLMLTGCRKSEILSLQWQHVDLDARELTLVDAKTGPRTVPLSPSAVTVLGDLPRKAGNPWVLPGLKAGKHLNDIEGAWTSIRRRAELDGVRMHDLRHSFASRALALGQSLPMIGKLLGHRQVETTGRYAHLARESVHEAATRISDSIAGDIL